MESDLVLFNGERYGCLMERDMVLFNDLVLFNGEEEEEEERYGVV